MFKTASTLKLVSFFLLTVCLASCNEDTIEPTGEGIISGVVLSAETGGAIAAASITTNPATSALITDAEGKFLIPAVSGGEYSITAKKSGYKTEAVSVAVKDGQQTSVTIVLEETKTGNAAPGLPAAPTPATGAQSQPISITLAWSGPGTTDTLSYDVLLYESGAAQKKKLAENIRDTTAVASGLKYNTTYFWQVIARDTQGNATNGDVWSFTTVALPEARYLFARSLDGNYDIYSSDGTEANTFRLTSEFSREWWPVLSPRRDKIAYTSNAGIEPQIYTMNRDGSDKQQITTLPVAGYHNAGIGFAWAPDGGKLLYANYENLYSINRDGSGLTLLAKAPAERHFRLLDWTSRGEKIVAQTIGSNINESEIYLLNADGTGMTLLVENLPGRVESPSFSIDGKSILYTRDAAGFENAEGRQLDARIFMKKLDGSGEADLSAHKPAGTNDLYPKFSPDGAKVIFLNTSNDGLGPNEIWMMDAADGRNRVKLFSNATMPDWK